MISQGFILIHYTQLADGLHLKHHVPPYWAERIDHHLRHLRKQIGLHL